MEDQHYDTGAREAGPYLVYHVRLFVFILNDLNILRPPLSGSLEQLLKERFWLPRFRQGGHLDPTFSLKLECDRREPTPGGRACSSTRVLAGKMALLDVPVLGEHFFHFGYRAVGIVRQTLTALLAHVSQESVWFASEGKTCMMKETCPPAPMAS